MALLNCGDKGDFWAEHALLCLPDDIRNEWDNRLTIICMAESDGRRLTRKSREGKEIIILAERIVPSSSSNEDSADVRYFVFALLHEIAHAIYDDPPPNENSKEENEAIETRANSLAFQ
jgi:Zn-dependent peptidase ImmA (M78 family)